MSDPTRRSASNAKAAPGTPPQETGTRLATFPRPGPKGDAELRVSLDSYEGHPYITVRLWTKSAGWGNAPSWWPTPKGVSVRLGEAREVAAALLEGLELSGFEDRQPRGGSRRSLPGNLPDPSGSGRGEFDEFAD
jgi:hypothetical protein